jgi:hypothetical protein
MPFRRSGNRRLFDPGQVVEWMVTRFIPRDPYADGGVVATTRRELAHVMHVSPRTVSRWMATPGFPGIKGRTGWLFPVHRISRWLFETTATTIS